MSGSIPVVTVQSDKNAEGLHPPKILKHPFSSPRGETPPYLANFTFFDSGHLGRGRSCFFLRRRVPAALREVDFCLVNLPGLSITAAFPLRSFARLRLWEAPAERIGLPVVCAARYE